MNRFRSVAWRVVLVGALGSGSFGQKVIATLQPGRATKLAPCGDLDGDGRSDLLVSRFDRPYSTAPFVDLRVEAISSATFQTRFTFRGSNTSVFGYALHGGVDFEGDGVPDVLIGAPVDANDPQDEYVEVYSGADGGLLYRHSKTTREAFGMAVRFLDDLDGDGYRDLAVGSPLWGNASRPAAGKVSVVSGGTDTSLYVILGPVAGAWLGASLDVIGDQNGDGIKDLVIGMPGSGGALVASGVDGAQLASIPGPTSELFDDTYAIAVGDTNGDGLEDLVVEGAGQPTLYDGSGSTIRTLDLNRTRSRAVWHERGTPLAA